MATKTEICNIALLTLKAETVSNIETDKTIGARACRVFFNEVLRLLLEEFPWPFAQVREYLSKVEDNPTSDWAYSYAYPPDSARILSVPTGAQTGADYSVVYGEQSRLIYTNQPEAEIVYTRFITDTGRFPPSFSMALSYKLASAIAVSVCEGDLFKLGELAEAKYRQTITTAKLIAQKERQNKNVVDSSMVTARL